MRGEWCATVLLVALLATEAAEAQLVARRITQETARTDLFSGSDAVGGAGDWFLSNGIVRAIIDDIGVQTDLAIPGQPAPPPIANLAAPSGGTVIDLGLVGKRNDQLPQVLQIVNFNTASPIVYVPASVALGNAALPAVAARVDEAEGLAQLKVYGYVPMPGVSDGSNRALPARTEYTVRRGENYLRLATTVTNLSANPVPLFSIVDVVALGARSLLPFAVFPGRGFRHPALDPGNILPAIGVYPYVSLTGRVGPGDGVMDTVAMTPADEVSYTLFAPNQPLFGVNSDALVAAGNPPLTEPLAPGETRRYERLIIVADRNDVASSADSAIDLLGGFGGFPTTRVRGRVVAPDALPFRAAIEVAQIDMDPRTTQPETLLTPVLGGADPLPLNQTTTDSGRGGAFEFVLPPGIYEMKVTAEERAEIPPVRFQVAPASGLMELPPVVLSSATRIRVVVSPAGPAKIVFKGEAGTPDPHFGLPVELRVGGAPVAGPADLGSPALNVVYTAIGQAEVVIRPGRYRVYASRGLESTVDMAEVVLVPGETKSVALETRHVVDTSGWISADFHVHSARSFDSSVPPRDRVISFAAAGVHVMVSTEHDFLFDSRPVIESLGLADRITAIVGDEITTGAVPSTYGHFNAWPLPVTPLARRHGAPEDEFVEPNILYDRVRAMGAGVVQLNHPEDRLFGLFWLMGFDLARPLSAPPNDFLLRQSITGTGTRNLDFDTLEVYSTPSITQYLLAREFWFSLLNQGVPKTATAVSDSHRVVLENPGFPRTYVWAGSSDLRGFDLAAFNQNLKAMQAMGTSGPFLTVDVAGQERSLGRLVPLPPDRILRLRIRVQAAPWVPVEEIRIFGNGRPLRWIKFPATTAPVRFDAEVPVSGLARDTWIVVEAGKVLAADPRDRTPPAELMEIVEPGVTSLAFTNPIFIDVDGNGRFDPPGVQPPPAFAVTQWKAMRYTGERGPEEPMWLRMTPAEAGQAAGRLRLRQ